MGVCAVVKEGRTTSMGMGMRGGGGRGRGGGGRYAPGGRGISPEMRKASIAKLKEYFRKHKKAFVLGFIFTACTNLIGVYIPILIKNAVNSIDDLDALYSSGVPITTDHIAHLTPFLYGVVGLAILAGGFRILSRLTLFYAGREIEYDLRNQMFVHLAKLQPSYFSHMETGDIMSRATNDLNFVRMMLGVCLLTVFNTSILYVTALPMMIGISGKLTLLVLLPYPLMFIVIKLFTGKLADRSMEVQEKLAGVSSFVQEDLSGISVIKAYAREKQEFSRFTTLNDDYLESNIKLAKLRAGMMGVMTAFGSLQMLVLVWFGGLAVIDKEIQIGTLFAFSIYLVMFTWPTMALGWIITILQRGMAAMGRIMEVLTTEPLIADGPQTDFSITDIQGEIEFRGFSFAHVASNGAGNGDADATAVRKLAIQAAREARQDGASRKEMRAAAIEAARGAREGSGNGEDAPPAMVPVVRDVSLKIPAGQTIAIVGRTGSGKTTLAHAIPRLLEIEPGQLFIDGHDITTIPLHVLRRHIGMVPQDSFLFSTTLEENICLGPEHVTEDEMLEAAHLAALDKDVQEFTDKYQTVVGERGLMLSGGQKQRTALARAAVLKPRILVLDDALSSVDTNTEEEILRDLRGLMKGRTSVMISHRVSAVKDADHIVVLDDGAIVEQGTHDELIAGDGFYSELYERQRLEDELARI